ncbi:MAG TPA: hypothetical protein DIU37_02215 [Opitutae bacterium]|nr:hypothetical protein [Opitutae bacterium]|tara:strand:- start:1307 stop:2224 length:918 start_codon:yes stop_codon:yes gene_type:complete
MCIAGVLSLRADALTSEDEMKIRESGLYLLQGSYDGAKWLSLDIEEVSFGSSVQGVATQACAEAGYKHCRVIEVEEDFYRELFDWSFKLLSRGQGFNAGIVAEKIAYVSQSATGIPVHLPAAVVGNVLNTVSVYAALIEGVEGDSPEFTNGLKGDAAMLAAWIVVCIADGISMAADYSKAYYKQGSEAEMALGVVSDMAAWAAIASEFPLAAWDLKSKVVKVWELEQNEFPAEADLEEAQDQAWQAVYAYSLKFGSSLFGLAAKIAISMNYVDGDNPTARWLPRVLSFMGAWWYLHANLGDPNAE